MKKLIYLLPFLTLNCFAQDLVQTPVLKNEERYDGRHFKQRESHWLVSFGFESLKYEVPFDFQGERKKYEPGEQEMFGGRLGVGREFYLGSGFITTSTVEAFYVGTLFERAIDAAPEEETVEFSFSKKTGNVFGGEIIQSIGYLFNMKTRNPIMGNMTYLVIEPFAEVGIGRAQAYNRRNYNYDTSGISGGVDESYRMRVVDDLFTQRLGVGFRVTSNEGYFFYLKASQHNYDVTKRKTEGFLKPDGVATRQNFKESSTNVDLDPVLVYSFGGGYKW